MTLSSSTPATPQQHLPLPCPPQDAAPHQRPPHASVHRHELFAQCGKRSLLDALRCPSTPAASFRHSGWLPHRNQVIDALLHNNVGLSRLERFLWCGSTAFLLRSLTDPEQFKLATNHCRDRWCVPCSKQRSRVIAANLTLLIRGKQTRFITLTMKHSDQPLNDQVDRLYHSFAALRRTNLWRRTVTAGCSVIEVKRSPDDAAWHVHLHVIVEGKYIAHAALRTLWHAITGDSYVVDVRLVKQDRDVARYVSKYVTKPYGSKISEKTGLLAELMHALDGRRLIQAFGDWRGLPLTQTTENDTYQNLGDFEDWLRRYVDGEPNALHALRDFPEDKLKAAIAALSPPPTHEPRASPNQLRLDLAW